MLSPSTIRARELRALATPPERQLWSVLRQLRPQGFHFRRQAPLAGYFPDFVCFSARLVIEVDGAHHGHPEQQSHDQHRDEVLRAHGFKVLRIAASDVMANLDGVYRLIRDNLGLAAE